MADTDLQLKAIDALVLIHKAIKNVQLYPSSDLTIINSIEMLYLHLVETLRQNSSLVFVELEKKTLLDENVLNQQGENTIHVLSLLDILRGLDIKSVSFDKDLEKEELHILINLFSIKPKEVQSVQDEEIVSILDILEEPISKSAARNVEAQKEQITVSEPKVAEEPISESAARNVEAQKEQITVSEPKVAEEPISESAVKSIDAEKDRIIVSEPELAEEPISESAAKSIDAEKDQIIVSDPELAEEPISESAAKSIDAEKEQIIVSEPELAEEPISESAAKSIDAEKDQIIVSEPELAEEPISESIAKIEKVFIRLNALDGAVSAHPSEEQMNMINRLSIRAAEWIEQSTNFSFEYKEICHRLQKLLQDFIDNGYFAEANPIIDVFSKINIGTLQKDNLLREVSLEVLKNLTSENNVNILLKEINSNEQNKSTEARKLLAGFGNKVINKLLNNLLNASDSKQRISIIHIIEEMGQEAIPAISASIRINSPWYYLRNMAYILGRIGNETCIDILQPLLLHKDKRVRMEAFKSINQTGGSKKGQVFLSVLPQVDQQLRINIIEILGKIKYTEAVADLQDMIKIKTSMAKDEQISLHEKICNALGAIGSPEAIKTLSEIAESKSILGIGSYSKEVKYAAKRVLASIKK
jgi:HEAT repeat protein